MKNESWKYPFETFGDARFDANKDGKLDSCETFWRDAHLNEMEIRAEDDGTKQQPANFSNNKNVSVSNGITVFFFAILIALIIGGGGIIQSFVFLGIITVASIFFK